MLALSSTHFAARVKIGGVANGVRRDGTCKSFGSNIHPDRMNAHADTHEMSADDKAQAFLYAGTRNAKRLQSLYTSSDERLETKGRHGSHASDLRTCERFLGYVEAQKQDALYFDFAFEFLNKTIGSQSGHMPLSVPKPLTKEVQAIAFEHLHSLARTFAKTSDRNMHWTFRILRTHLHPDSALMPSQRKQLAQTILDRALPAQGTLEHTAMCRYITVLAQNSINGARDLQGVARTVEEALRFDSPLPHTKKAALAWVAAGTARTHAAFAPVHDVAFAHILSLANALHHAHGVEFFDVLDRTSLSRALSPDSPLDLEQKKQFASIWMSHPRATARAPEALAIVKPLSDIIDNAIERVQNRDDAYAENAALARHILSELPNESLLLLHHAEKLSTLYVT